MVLAFTRRDGRFSLLLLPIVRNTHTALDGLPPGLREAGRAASV